MDSIGKFWNVSPGTYVLYDVPIGNHFFEAKVIFAKWKGFKEVENNIQQFRAYDFPIPVSGHSEIVEMANFSDRGIGKNWVPEPVTYDFYLLGWTRVNDWLDLLYKFQVTFNAENIKNIKSNLKEAKRA